MFWVLRSVAQTSPTRLPRGSARTSSSSSAYDGAASIAITGARPSTSAIVSSAWNVDVATRS